MVCAGLMMKIPIHSLNIQTKSFTHMLLTASSIIWYYYQPEADILYGLGLICCTSNASQT